VPPPIGSQAICPRAFAAFPTGTSEITRAPVVGRDAEGSVRAVRSFGAVEDWVADAPTAGRSVVDGSGSGRLATRGVAGSGARFGVGAEVAGAAGSGACVAAGAGAAGRTGSTTGGAAGGAEGASAAPLTGAAGVETVGSTFIAAVSAAGGVEVVSDGRGSCGRDTLTVIRNSEGIHA